MISAVTWALLAGTTLVVLVIVPGAAWTDLATPETRALYAYFVALIALAWCQRTSRFRAEQIVLALFLAGMPLIYLEAYLVRGGPIVPELLGLVLFGVLAALSLWRSPWFAVGGLALHGLGWDLWHLDSPVPAWYAIACAAIDVALAVHAAARVTQRRRASDTLPE
jgi:hypothetical protein